MHPVLIHIGPVRIFTYGVMVMMAFLAAVWWSVRAGRSRGLSADQVMDAAVWVFLPALIGARALYILLNPGEFAGFGDWFRVWEGGMSFHGGLVGGVLGGFAYARRSGINPWTLADVGAPGAALGYAVGRLGCLFNGCCYGMPCSLPWAMTFTDPATGLKTPPSHPTQLYSSLAGLLMFAVLVWLFERPVREGYTALAGVALYAVYRFGVEFARAGATGERLSGALTQAQMASVVMLLAAAAGAWWLSRRTVGRSIP